jgi:hypothetical protein
MRQSNIDKIEEALNTFGTEAFSISELCKKSKVSDPTIRNYLKSSTKHNLREVSYGKYQIISKNPLNQTPTPKPEMKKVQDKSPQTTNGIGETSTQPTIAQPLQVHGELYLNAYLKGFDRGFELGLKKASELEKGS